MNRAEMAELLIHLSDLGAALRAQFEANPTKDNDRKASVLEAAYDVVAELVEEMED